MFLRACLAEVPIAFKVRTTVKDRYSVFHEAAVAFAQLSHPFSKYSHVPAITATVQQSSKANGKRREGLASESVHMIGIGVPYESKLISKRNGFPSAIFFKTGKTCPAQSFVASRAVQPQKHST